MLPPPDFFRRDLITLLTCCVLFWFCSYTQAQTIHCKVSLQTFRIINGTKDTNTDFSGKANVSLDFKTGDWLIDNIDNNQKFACTQKDYILDKPSYKETNFFWYMVSPFQDGYPIDLDLDQRLIWFAYCGRNFLEKRNQQAVILPFGDARLDCYVHGCKMFAQWNSEKSLCPNTAQFRYDKDLFAKGVKQLSFEPNGSYLNDRNKQFTSYISNYTNNQLVAEFNVTQWTNNFGIEIPLSWEMKTYWYGQPSFICLGTSEGIEINHDKISYPGINLKAKITDKRVRNLKLGLNYVNYLITDGHIPAIDKVKLPSVSPDRFFQMTPDLRKPRIVVMGLMGILTIIPLVIWIYAWKKNKQN